jgi:putative spermidine/putrescine transport system substrate-binding protein
MDRRSFLQTLGILSLTQLVSSCGSNPPETLRVRLLKQSLPSQIIKEFGQSLHPNPTLEFKPKNDFKDLFELLKELSKPKSQSGGWSLPFDLPFTEPRTQIIPDLVSLGDAWLAKAIKENLIQPLAVETLSKWQYLPENWQDLVKRNDKGFVDSAGKIWGAPYRWGSTVIIYRQDKFKQLGWEPQDWEDLWRPELKGRISLLDNYREVIGLTLKRLSRSYNTENLESLTNLKSTLEELNSQVKFYTSDAYLQPLILEDTWLAVGWSTDYLEVKRKGASDRSITAIIPASGTALSADLWVRPKPPATNPNQQILAQWIDFCWENQTANKISLFTAGASPIFWKSSMLEIPENIQTNPLLLPPKSVMSQSEFITPLPNNIDQQYRKLWQEIRNKPEVA